MKYFIPFLVFCSTPAFAEIDIMVDRSDLEATIRQNGQVVAVHPVAMGKPGDETPLGSWTFREIHMNPDWYGTRGQGYVRPGPRNPLGRVRFRYNMPYAMHGTNNPASIGTYASLGCIRMQNEDIIEIARLIFQDSGNYQGDEWFRNMVNNPTHQYQIPLNRSVRITVQE